MIGGPGSLVHQQTHTRQASRLVQFAGGGAGSTLPPATNASAATSHQLGGRHATRPIQMPHAKVSAAENRGCRAGISLGDARGCAVCRGESALSGRALVSSANAEDWEAVKFRDSEGELAGQVENTLDVKRLGKQID